MTGKTGRVPVVKTTVEQRASWDWSTVPMAQSPKGFAELPYPWQEAKDAALKAHRQAQTAPAAQSAGLPSDTALVKAKSSRQQAARATLSDLAERLGTHHAPARQRQAEVYDMLFHALRDKPVSILHLSAQADDAGSDGPAADALWLEYFPKGAIHALDRAALSAPDHDRFTPHQADPEDAAALRKAVAGAQPFDIILDEASHASHHQQTAFLALFPQLKPGGFYIIDGLRSQPDALERPGITRTAVMFRGFAQNRSFTHSDPATAAAFAALSPDIAGCVLFQVNFDKSRRDQIAVIQKR